MVGGMAFRFNILVVEDQSDWLQFLDDALTKRFANSDRFSWQLVTNARAAWDQLVEKRYHFVSIDQNIPYEAGGAINPSNGLDLCQRMVEQKLLTQRIIFTGSGKAHYGNRIGKLGGTPYLEKSISGVDAPDENIYSARGWAQFIESTLENTYVSFVLEEAGKFLPLALAERARRAISAYKNRSYEPYVRLWLEIWESVLNLAFAQTLALCYHASVRLSVLPNDNPADKEKILKEAWPRLASANWMGPWLRYIGQGNKNTGAGAGTRFLQGASEPLRRLRNEIAHTFSMDVWRNKAETHKDPLLFLVDAIAFWVENPLLIRLRFHPSVSGQLMGQAIAGDQLPFLDWQVDAIGLEKIPDLSTDKACVLWRRAGEKAQVIVLDPFITLEREQNAARQDLLLISHPSNKDGTWVYRSLTEGRMVHRKLSSVDQRAVNVVFR